MTPKEKALELFLKFRQMRPYSPYTGIGDGEAKQCVLIAVDEILICCIGSHEDYWQEVKKEIINL
jgi:hypothetical protein